MKLFLTLVLVVSLLVGNVSFAGQSCCGGQAVAPAAPVGCSGAKPVASCSGPKRAKATPVRDLIERALVRSLLGKIIAASKTSGCSGAKAGCSGQ